MKPEKKFEFRAYINAELVNEIGASLKKVWEPFDNKQFTQNVVPKLANLALKERTNLIAEEMYQALPKDFGKAGQILLDSLGAELGGVDFTGDGLFFYMAHGVYVSWYGLEEEHFELATTFLYEMTKRFSAEFAIRPFLEKYPNRMLEKLRKWVKDENQHVRRLVSEGTRTRLPWAPRVSAYDADYKPIIELLSQLKNDPELYVRRSVANHLNDLTKDRVALALATLKNWNKKQTDHIKWITKHALRSLIKAGNKEALELLGFSDAPKIAVTNFKLGQKKLPLGEKQEISFEINSQSAEIQPLMIDYIVYFKKANGKQSPKVFKLKILELKGKASVTVQKNQRFRPRCAPARPKPCFPAVN